MSVLFAIYIIVRVKNQPELAPMYKVDCIPLTEKLKDSLIYIVSLGFIIVLVIGSILLGIASPTEAAAMGALGSLILAACYRLGTARTMAISRNNMIIKGTEAL